MVFSVIGGGSDGTTPVIRCSGGMAWSRGRMRGMSRFKCPRLASEWASERRNAERREPVGTRRRLAQARVEPGTTMSDLGVGSRMWGETRDMRATEQLCWRHTYVADVGAS